MKIRYILHILVILILLGINDGIYYFRTFSQKEAKIRAEQVYEKINENPAILIVTEEHSEVIMESIGNLYFVESVRKQNKQSIIQMLSEQYRLEEAQSLLGDLSLPAILEIQFSADKFAEMESSLFLQATEKEEGIFQLIYSEENYRLPWQTLEKINIISEIIENYWFWVYWGLGLIILLVAVYFRINYEQHKKRYWEIYIRAGGSQRRKRVIWILNTIFMVLIPALIVLGGEYYLWSFNYPHYIPDFRFHTIRAAVLLSGSLIALLFTRRGKYDQIHS